MLLTTSDGNIIRGEGDTNRRLEPIGTLIRTNRLQKRLSQRGLARALVEASANDACDREQVARWEGSRRIPSPYWRHWLAVVLPISEEDLSCAAAVSRLMRSLPR